MLSSKRMTLKPLLESNEGIHLTAYLVNNGDLVDLKSQLQEAISQSYLWLNPVMSPDERTKFLEPLHSLLLDAQILKQMKGNIGLFRNQDSFRILNIPIDVEQTCQVATSFHVKPLLRWLQTDQDFLLLGLEQNSAQLYIGSQDSLKFVDSIPFPDAAINDWIAGLTRNINPKLFVAGQEELVATLKQSLNYKNLVEQPIAHHFDPEKLAEICESIRVILKQDSKRLIEKALYEFHFAEEGNRTQKNIFQIAKAVVKGRVRKLIVSDEINIFGKIDLKSGGLAIHPFDLDHEDDDILDDLAQMVLSQGGEVIVASRNEIPKGRPILAILDDEGLNLEKSEDRNEHQPLQARLG